MAEPSETTQITKDPGGPEIAELLGAVRALSAQVGGLQAELQALRAQTRALPESTADAPHWDETAPAQREQSVWMRSLEGPGPRPPAIPRVLLEVVFLVAVAAAAAIAELDPLLIGVLMAGAWVIVALAEWIASRAGMRRAEMSAMPLAGAGAVFADDPSWFAPPVERTMLGAIEDTQAGIEDTQAGEEAVTTTRLPPPSAD